MWRPRTLAVVGALLGWSAAFVPSLLPRPWWLQGAISAFAIGSGYIIGHLAARSADLITRHTGLAVPKRVGYGLKAATGGLLVWAVVLHFVWQADVSELMDLDRFVAGYLLAAIAAGVVLGYFLVSTLRLVHSIWRAAVQMLARRTSPARAMSLAVAALLLSSVLVFDLLIADRLVGALSDAYWRATVGYDDDVSQPALRTLAGGPGSLIAWDEMGRQGREFVASARTRVELEQFNGRPGKAPIRVYAGLRSPGTVRERAQLAVDELERAGGFERAAIVVVAPTGTGWVNPSAIDSLEFIFNGDTAAVAVQYSHLPSWVLLIGNQDLAIESSKALFDALKERLAAIDEGDRPILLLYGESLGSFALESMFDDLHQVREETDGVLWVGPPRANPLWQEIMEQRTSDSPVWRPVIGGGETVRFGHDGRALSSVPGSWDAPRIAYLQHASDPITWLSPDMILRRPEWLDSPRGPDVSRWVPYIPGLTFLQVFADLVMGTNAPVGHGHKFGVAQAEAWALVASPEAWSPDDTDRLRDLIEAELADAS